MQAAGLHQYPDLHFLVQFSIWRSTASGCSEQTALPTFVRSPLRPMTAAGPRTYFSTIPSALISPSYSVVRCAASTSRNRSSTLPCLLMCPSRRRSPLDSSTEPVPDSWRSACRSENAPAFRSSTRRPAPSADRLRDASSAAASPDTSPLPASIACVRSWIFGVSRSSKSSRSCRRRLAHGANANRLQLLSSRWPPQRLLAAQAFVQRHHMQLIHHPRAHLHHAVPMPQQLPQIPILRSSVPRSAESDPPAATAE